MAESKDIQSEIIPKISTGFCAGIARTSGICGAVTGGIMAISLLYGRSSPDEPIEKSYIPVQKFIEIFENKFGSTNCKQLTGIDLGTEDGRKRFISENKIEQCRKYAEEAARMVMLVIEERS